MADILRSPAMKPFHPRMMHEDEKRKSFHQTLGRRGMMWILCLSLFPLMAGCSDKKDSLSERIVSKREHTLQSVLNVHGSPLKVLTIDGKRFEHVRGVEKFYLELTKTNAVLFVVDNRDTPVIYHIYKLDTREDIQIKEVSISGFGRDIGATNSSDSIEEVGDGKIVLTTVGRDMDSVITDKYLICLDLEKRAVVSQKHLTFDKEGKVIREYDAMLRKWTIGTDPNKR